VMSAGVCVSSNGTDRLAISSLLKLIFISESTTAVLVMPYAGWFQQSYVFSNVCLCFNVPQPF
jgi:hypothetical protein